MNTKLSVPSVAPPVTDVSTKALSAFTEPASTKVNNPPVTSEELSASVVLVRTAAFEPSPTVVTE